MTYKGIKKTDLMGASAHSIGEFQHDDNIETIGAVEGDLYILLKNTPENVEISKYLFFN